MGIDEVLEAKMTPGVARCLDLAQDAVLEREVLEDRLDHRDRRLEARVVGGRR